MWNRLRGLMAELLPGGSRRGRYAGSACQSALNFDPLLECALVRGQIWMRH